MPIVKGGCSLYVTVSHSTITATVGPIGASYMSEVSDDPTGSVTLTATGSLAATAVQSGSTLTPFTTSNSTNARCYGLRHLLSSLHVLFLLYAFINAFLGIRWKLAKARRYVFGCHVTTMKFTIYTKTYTSTSYHRQTLASTTLLLQNQNQRSL